MIGLTGNVAMNHIQESGIHRQLEKFSKQYFYTPRNELRRI